MSYRRYSLSGYGTGSTSSTGYVSMTNVNLATKMIKPMTTVMTPPPFDLCRPPVSLGLISTGVYLFLPGILFTVKHLIFKRIQVSGWTDAVKQHLFSICLFLEADFRCNLLLHTCIHTHTQTGIHTHTHTHTQAYTHTHTHTHTRP